MGRRGFSKPGFIGDVDNEFSSFIDKLQDQFWKEAFPTDDDSKFMSVEREKRIVCAWNKTGNMRDGQNMSRPSEDSWIRNIFTKGQ